MSKKEDEIKILQSFKACWEDFPHGKIEKHESPDFIVRPTTKRSIGIEITRLYLIDPKNRNLKNEIKAISPQKLLEKINKSLQKKDEKRRLYQKKRTDSLWLIIASDKITDLIPLNFQNLLEKQIFESEFDKVFLLESHKKKVYQLK